MLRFPRRSANTSPSSGGHDPNGSNCRTDIRPSSATKGLYVGVPVKLGRAGVEEIIEIKLTAEEQAAFDKSAAAVKELVDKLKL